MEFSVHVSLSIPTVQFFFSFEAFVVIVATFLLEIVLLARFTLLMHIDCAFAFFFYHNHFETEKQYTLIQKKTHVTGTPMWMSHPFKFFISYLFI